MPQIIAEWIPALGPCEVPLLNRAAAAYWRTAIPRHDGRAMPPGPDRVQLAGLDGKQYVILWITGQPLPRVYRVRAYDGILRLMKRPPRGLC
jgi:hypothetical protein